MATKVVAFVTGTTFNNQSKESSTPAPQHAWTTITHTHTHAHKKKRFGWAAVHVYTGCGWYPMRSRPSGPSHDAGDSSASS